MPPVVADRASFFKSLPHRLVTDLLHDLQLHHSVGQELQRPPRADGEFGTHVTGQPGIDRGDTGEGLADDAATGG